MRIALERGEQAELSAKAWPGKARSWGVVVFCSGWGPEEAFRVCPGFRIQGFRVTGFYSSLLSK